MFRGSVDASIISLIGAGYIVLLMCSCHNESVYCIACLQGTVLVRFFYGCYEVVRFIKGVLMICTSKFYVYQYMPKAKITQLRQRSFLKLEV